MTEAEKILVDAINKARVKGIYEEFMKVCERRVDVRRKSDVRQKSDS